MSVDENLSNIPFGNIETFYEKCIYGNEDLPEKFKDDYGGTVLFYRSLKEYFGDLSQEDSRKFIFGITSFSGNDSPSIFWDGKELMEDGLYMTLPKKVSERVKTESSMVLSGRVFSNRIHLVEETDNYRHFMSELNPRYVTYRHYVTTDNLAENRTYKLKVVETNKDEEGNKLYFISLNFSPKNLNIVSFFIPKVKADLKSLPSYDDLVESTPFSTVHSVEEYNKLNPCTAKFKGKALTIVPGLNIIGYYDLSKEFVDSLNIDENKEYTKNELIALGLNSFRVDI